jgi:hypothetical protein
MGLRGERSLGTSSPRRGRKRPTLRTRQGLAPEGFLPLVTPFRLPGEPQGLEREAKADWILLSSRDHLLFR